MKKKIISAVCILLVIISVSAIWYHIPVRLLRTGDIASIYVFDGNRGTEFTLTDPDDITYVVDTFKDVRFKRCGLALGMGSSFHMKFYTDTNKLEATFILQFYNGLVRKGIFFYEPVDKDSRFNDLFDYLDALSLDAHSENH